MGGVSNIAKTPINTVHLDIEHDCGRLVALEHCREKAVAGMYAGECAECAAIDCRGDYRGAPIPRKDAGGDEVCDQRLDGPTAQICTGRDCIGDVLVLFGLK